MPDIVVRVSDSDVPAIERLKGMIRSGVDILLIPTIIKDTGFWPQGEDGKPLSNDEFGRLLAIAYASVPAVDEDDDPDEERKKNLRKIITSLDMVLSVSWNKGDMKTALGCISKKADLQGLNQPKVVKHTIRGNVSHTAKANLKEYTQEELIAFTRAQGLPAPESLNPLDKSLGRTDNVLEVTPTAAAELISRNPPLDPKSF